jgi:hypothetical protein
MGEKLQVIMVRNRGEIRNLYQNTTFVRLMTVIAVGIPKIEIEPQQRQSTAGWRDG